VARRGTNSKGLWAAGGLAAAVLLLTGYAMFSGSDGEENAPAGGATATTGVTGSPTPGYSAPDEWDEPQRWASLPRGTRTVHGLPTGFPHTTEGAVAALAAANTTEVEGEVSMVDVQLARFDTYFCAEDRSAAQRVKVEQAAAKTDARLRTKLGLPADGDLPAGAYARNYVIGYKVVREMDDEVGVYLLSRATLKASETAKEQGSYSRTVAVARWEDGDWKVSAEATLRVAREMRGQAPAIAAPGDMLFNTEGWTALREAS
jgi:hypothetical protein